ncbi:MAG: hypothetical protein LBT37_03580 [Lactobacillaceae bacterium]|jgi:hypothetical protein|nr:hypothetical protein [Lactobacillaceae bacterium]
MVKQGSFARTAKTKRVRSIKQKKQTDNSASIDDKQINDYLIVRYHLTQHAKQAPVVEETMLRFFNVFMSQDESENVWRVDVMLPKTLVAIGNQVPWQFYYLVANEWERFAQFLAKEVPAVPLQVKKIVTDLTETQTVEIFAKHLALNWFISQFGADQAKLTQITEAQVQALQESFIAEEKVAWDKVAIVYSQVEKVVVGNETDDKTKQWIADLEKINI